MRPIFAIEDGNADAGAGTPPPAEGGTPPADTGTDVKAEMEALKVERDNALKMAQDAQALEKRLVVMADQDPEAISYIRAKLRGEPVTPPTQRTQGRSVAEAAEGGLDFDALDDNTKAIVGAIIEQNTNLEAQVKGLSAQMTAVNERNVTADFDSQINAAREDLGADVVDELMPQALKMIEANPGLASVPNAAITILKALDHDNVATRKMKQREGEEQERQAKLLRARGLGKRGMSSDSGPGGERKKRSHLEVFRSAINAVVQGDDS
jgi:hypothetical protein